MYNTEKAFEAAKEFYAQYGIDVEKAIEICDKTPMSMHCWQGDDVKGFEHKDGALTGGIQATGNYPGAARTADELRWDIKWQDLSIGCRAFLTSRPKWKSRLKWNLQLPGCGLMRRKKSNGCWRNGRMLTRKREECFAGTA